jgi:hypothetical protein
MPMLSKEMAKDVYSKGIQRKFLLLQKQKYAMNIRRLDMVAGAIKNDGSHPQHSALYDSLNKFVEREKKELADLYEEGLKYMIMHDITYQRRNPHDTHYTMATFERVYRYDSTGV